MFNVAKGFVAFCNAAPGIVAVFGKRVTAEHVPDGQAMPYAVCNVVTTDRLYTHSGAAGQIALLQVDIFGATQAQADTAQAAIVEVLDGYEGVFGAANVGYIFIQKVSGVPDAETRRFRRTFEAKIAVEE